MHARTVLSGIIYAFPEARQCYSRVAEDLEGYGREQNKEPTSGLELLTPAPATSLLAHVLVRPENALV